MTVPVTGMPVPHYSQLTQPLTEELTASTLETCDRCGLGVQAVYLVRTPRGSKLTLCAHDAVTLGFVARGTLNYMHAEEKQKGDQNLWHY